MVMLTEFVGVVVFGVTVGPLLVGVAKYFISRPNGPKR